MKRILALDLATKCGWAHGNFNTSGVWDLSIRRDESSGMRLIRLEGKLTEMAALVGIDIVVFEAARHAAPKMQGALVVHAELQGVVKAWCENLSINFRGYSPSEIKRHATGKGNANKEAVLKAAREKWPDIQIIDDNHADALWLLSLALKELCDVHS